MHLCGYLTSYISIIVFTLSMHIAKPYCDRLGQYIRGAV